MSSSTSTTIRAGSHAPSSERTVIRVCLVGPSLGILGGQALQAARLQRYLSKTPGIDVEFLPINPVLPGPLRLLQRVKYVRTLVTSIAYVVSLLATTRRYDVMHIFSASYLSFLIAPAPAILIGRLFGRGILLNYRSGEADDHLDRWRRSAIPLLRMADAIIVPSDYLVGVFDRHGLEADAIANVVDLDRYRLRIRERLSPRFLGNRNFAPHYNVACVIRAFARIRTQLPGATLVLAGDGECREELERLVDDLSLRDAVTFTGQVPPERMAQLYDEADVYLNAPSIDNMPGSILEAFACGLPVVTTDAGGIPFVVEHERNGLMVACDDDEALAREALRLFSESTLARDLAQAAREECNIRYTWPAVEREWVRTYERVARRSGTP